MKTAKEILRKKFEETADLSLPPEYIEANYITWLEDRIVEDFTTLPNTVNEEEKLDRLSLLRILNEQFSKSARIIHLEDDQARLVLDAMEIVSVSSPTSNLEIKNKVKDLQPDKYKSDSYKYGFNDAVKEVGFLFNYMPSTKQEITDEVKNVLIKIIESFGCDKRKFNNRQEDALNDVEVLLETLRTTTPKQEPKQLEI